ncbi:MAG: prephenate dehydrogenase/arogenate dehydrogenase family protein, partial [Candidatus Borkfalkia sp.]
MRRERRDRARRFEKPRNFRYVGCHPMAGKEVSGIRNADADLFRGASMILVENERTDAAAAETIASLGLSMGFGRIIRCDSDYHDAKIAYTSQLAHIVS